MIPYGEFLRYSMREVWGPEDLKEFAKLVRMVGGVGVAEHVVDSEGVDLETLVSAELPVVRPPFRLQLNNRAVAVDQQNLQHLGRNRCPVKERHYVRTDLTIKHFPSEAQTVAKVVRQIPGIIPTNVSWLLHPEWRERFEVYRAFDGRKDLKYYVLIAPVHEAAGLIWELAVDVEHTCSLYYGDVWMGGADSVGQVQRPWGTYGPIGMQWSW